MDTLLHPHPSNYWQVLKQSLKLYKLSFTKVIILALMLSIIVFIPRFLALIIGQDLYFNISPFSLHRLWMILIDLAGLIVLIGIIWRMNGVLHRAHEPLVEDLEVGLKKLVYVLLATIIQSAIIFAVFLTLIGFNALLVNYQLFDYQTSSMLFITLLFFAQCILICYISTLFVFFIPLIAIENKGVIGSLKRSVSLVWNHWWRVFSVQVTPWIIYLFILMIIRFVLKVDINIYFVNASEPKLWPTLLQVLLFAIFIPWVAATLLMQLKDIEKRKKLVTEK